MNSVHNLIDFVQQSLEKQGVKSCLSEDSYLDRQYCMYKDPRGNKCAVGHLIPVSKYRSVMEDMDASKLCIKYPSVLDSIRWKYKLTEDFDLKLLLEQLQEIHDHFEPREWGHKLKALKDEYA